MLIGINGKVLTHFSGLVNFEPLFEENCDKFQLINLFTLVSVLSKLILILFLGDNNKVEMLQMKSYC